MTLPLFEADPLRLDTQTPGRGEMVAATSRPQHHILGLDLSLTCTGLAGNAGLGWTSALNPPKNLRGIERLNWINATIIDRYLRDVTLVVIEGPSYGSQAGQSGHHERAGLWWLVVHTLWKRDIPYVVVSPKSRAKYATGKGNAAKDAVLREVTKRFPWFDGDNNEADALVLAAMGADHLGEPMVAMPALHREALDAIAWPEMAHA